MLIVENGMIYTGTDKRYQGSLFIVNGKFAQEEEVDRKLAKIINAEGKIITPGLIDVHTHLGINQEGVGQTGHDFNESSAAVTPQVRSLDGINMRDRAFEDARKAGITTVQVMPGSANVIGGEMVTVKTAGTVVDDCIVRNPSGLKAAMGENPKTYHRDEVQTRMGIAAELRQSFQDAYYYSEQREKGNCGVDIGKENLLKVLRKEIPLRVHAHRADDIATVLRIQKEFDISLTIEHATEGHHIASLLAELGIRVAVGPTMSTRPKIELAEQSWETVRALDETGVAISLTTDHPVIGIVHLRTSAILAVQNGLTEEKALQTITQNAARHLGIFERTGSIEYGKDADFVIWNGDPFDLRSRVVGTFIEGEVVFEKS